MKVVCSVELKETEKAEQMVILMAGRWEKYLELLLVALKESNSVELLVVMMVAPMVETMVDELVDLKVEWMVGYLECKMVGNLVEHLGSPWVEQLVELKGIQSDKRMVDKMVGWMEIKKEQKLADY
jgi:hypothetical protein